MKNKFNVLLILAIFVFFALGCSSIQKSITGDKSNSNDNRSLTEKAVDNVTDTESTGVAECDEVLKLISDYAKNKDDSIATRALKNLFLGQIKTQIKQAIDEHKGDKKQMAEKCIGYKKQIETELKKDQETNKNSGDKKQ